ncbi:MAG: hypothetical protein HOY79_33900 [Streptomyces sp.]|nr:hypothetical protein [Streptomyces sp.]NUS11314.1 hypothetical protein [Streptomyces sp.]NUS23411.1 hypothetical protein [Streptomyces sp.]
MSAFGNFFRSLAPGNDHELARTQYAGRESASSVAARKKAQREEQQAKQRRQQHRSRGVRDASRAGEAWETRDRRQQRAGASWFRST